METKIKLFVWTNFSPDYRPGLAFALAIDETEARRLVINDMGFEPIVWGNLTIHDADKQIAYGVSGGS